MNILRESMRGLYEAVRTEMSQPDFNHVMRVALVAMRIGNERNLIIGRLAAAAGLCHYAQRCLEYTGRDFTPNHIQKHVEGWLASDDFTPEQVELIVTAVSRRGLPNNEHDGAVTMALKDAHRVVTLSVDVIFRSGQRFSTLPSIDFAMLALDTRGDYNSRLSGVADIVDCLDWVKKGSPYCIRSHTAMRMAMPRAARLRRWINDLQRDLYEEGVLDDQFNI